MLLRNLHLIRIINLKKFSSVFSACLMSEIRNNVHFVWMNPSNRPSMRYQSSAPLIYPECAFTYLDLPDDPAIDLYVMGTLTGEKGNTSWLLFFQNFLRFPDRWFWSERWPTIPHCLIRNRSDITFPRVHCDVELLRHFAGDCARLISAKRCGWFFLANISTFGI